MSGTDITTTAAIIAGMFSLPKPFSRATVSVLEFENYAELADAAQLAGKSPERLGADFLCSDGI